MSKGRIFQRVTTMKGCTVTSTVAAALARPDMEKGTVE
jgi:hypothetical protein